MVASKSRNLSGALEQAEAVNRDAAARLPVTGPMIARQARHFAKDARLSREEPEAMRRLHEVTGRLRDLPSLSALLPRILDGALSLTDADFGTVQLLDPVARSLRIVTQSGFDPGFLEYFAVVENDHSAGGRAARQSAQVVIADVNADPGFAPHRDIAAVSGFRAVQSTPLADDAGHLVGVVSTYFRRPHRLADLDLLIMELYADVAGEAIAAHLGGPGDDGRDEPIGRAVISALPDPGDFAEYIVNRLFSVGLSLESARSIVGKGPAADRVAAATGEVDQLIRDIRTVMFSLAADGTAPLTERLAHAARVSQAAALDAAAQLEHQADLVRQPWRMDYPTEIKRWQAFARQAEQMAKRWEEQP
jgi:hypothetical protein